MILTCPSCQTKYVVKDGAIPPHGRQVRCAHCKESWHQMPEGERPDSALPPSPAPDHGHAPESRMAGAAHGPETASDQDFSDDAMASLKAGIAAEPVPDMDQPQAIAEEPQEAAAIDDIGGGPPEPVVDDGEAAAPPIEDAVIEPVEQLDDAEPAYASSDDDFAVQIPEEEDPPRGKGRLLLAIAVLLALAAAAAWFFAPDGIKSRLGIASSGKSPLELMVTTSDRQQLASGNELLAISGRVINPTAEEQAVPPIRAELRNKTSKAIVYQWTIAPPARSLPPGGSASFNSAEVDIPPGGDELTVTLANAAG